MWLAVVFIMVSCAWALFLQAQAPADPAAGGRSAEQSTVIPKGAKVFVAPMPDGFDQDIKTALTKKDVPVTLVAQREQADFEITGFSESEKAGAAKILITGSWHSRESASIKVANLKSGVIAYAYSYHVDNSSRGKKSSSEACAKHLKEKIDSGK
jgi:hypothetical protein